MTTQQLTQECNTFLQQLDGLDLGSLDWSSFDFEDTSISLSNAEWIAKRILARQGLAIPDVAAVQQHLTNTRRHLDRIQQFSLERGHSKRDRDQIQSGLDNEVSGLLTSVGAWAAIAALQLAEDPSSDAHRQLERIKQLRLEVDDLYEEIQKSAEAARGAAAEAGVAVFTEDFAREAKKTSRNAAWWLVPALLFAGVALAEVVRIVFFGEAPGDGWEWTYRMGGRVFGLSLLTYAAAWCGKVSLANLHAAAVNRHRAASILTLQAFRQAADDNATKDAVVLEAARAVFENVPTGYLAKAGANGQPTGRSMEVVRRLGGDDS